MLHTVSNMTPPEPGRCPRCGNTIPTRAAHGLCPACLLHTALADDDVAVDGPFPYRIITLLGGDPAAVTYLAQTLSGAPKYVALKIVRASRDAAAILSRFGQWKPLLTRFRHPSVAALFDAGPIGSDSIYLATDFVAGSALRSLLHDPAFDRPGRIEIARQLDAAVRAVHEGGLAHMRLDPSRIRIAAGMRAVIVGLGAALVIEGTPLDPELDRVALARIGRDLHASTPQNG